MFEYPAYTDEDWVDVGHRKSDAWRHFLCNRDQKTAKCKYCGLIMRNQGSTQCLNNHVKSKHRHLI